MSKLLEMDRLDRVIEDGNIRIRAIKLNLETIEREIDFLSTIQAQLEENIKCLKQEKIVAIALEYKRAKNDLARAKLNLTHLRNLRDGYRKAHADINHVLKLAMADMKKLQKSGDVLRGRFGRKNGQK